MENPNQTTVTRRKFLRVALVLTPAFAVTACGADPTAIPTVAPTAVPTTAPTTAPAQATTAATSAATTTAAAATSAATTQAAATTTVPATTAAATTQATTTATTTQPATTAAAATQPATTAAPTTVAGAAGALPPTPACGPAEDQTPAQTEGPYFKPNSPLLASLVVPGITGTRLLLNGYVLSTDCKPVARALLDFWQADDKGQYDNRGYRLRGHVFTDDAGRYQIETIVPAIYTGRARHIHVKVQAPNRPALTTQLYFPGDPGNAADRIYNKELEMELKDSATGKQGLFNFVLNLR